MLSDLKIIFKTYRQLTVVDRISLRKRLIIEAERLHDDIRCVGKIFFVIRFYKYGKGIDGFFIRAGCRRTRSCQALELGL